MKTKQWSREDLTHQLLRQRNTVLRFKQSKQSKNVVCPHLLHRKEKPWSSKGNFPLLETL